MKFSSVTGYILRRLHYEKSKLELRIQKETQSLKYNGFCAGWVRWCLYFRFVESSSTSRWQCRDTRIKYTGSLDGARRDYFELEDIDHRTGKVSVPIITFTKIPVLSIVKRWFGVMQEILSKGNLWRLVHSTNDMVWQLYALSAMIFLSMKIPFTDIWAILIRLASFLFWYFIKFDFTYLGVNFRWSQSNIV